MNPAQRALRICAKRLRALLGKPLDPEVVKLRANAPTVTPQETARLGRRWTDQPDTWVHPKPLDDDHFF